MLQITRTRHWRAETYRAPGPLRLGGRPPDLSLSILGRFVSDGRFVYQQIFPGFSIHLVRSGRGVMTDNGKPHDVGAGEGFAFFPNHFYDYHDAPESPWRYTWLTFEGTRVRAIFQHLGLSEASPQLGGIDMDHGIETALTEIQQVYEQSIIPPTYAISAAWRLIDAIAASKRSAPSATTRAASAGGARGIAETVRFFIDHHAMEFVTIEGLSRQLGLSRSALFRHFRAAYGEAPKTYLDSVRIGRAKKLLRQSGAPLKQIAAACGYTSTQYFIRAFVKACGVSPGKWRIRGDAR